MPKSKEAPPRSFQVSSLHEALAIATVLRASYGFDLFRGQVHGWVPTPSLLRRDPPARAVEIEKLERFFAWAEIIPELRPFADDESSLLAIAQHYGLSTPLLDVTSSLDVAAYFAIDGTPPPDSPDSVIFCGRSSWINEHTPCRVMRTAVPDLWRLEAQHGLFVDFSEAKGTIDLGWHEIYFNRSEARAPLEVAAIYPERRSRLEILLERFFLHEIAVLVGEFARQAPRAFKKRWRTYPGVFADRAVPAGPPPDRTPFALVGEKLAALTTQPLKLTLGKSKTPREARDAAAAALGRDLPRARNVLVQFEIAGTRLGATRRHAIQRALDYQWDGLRQLDVAHEEIALSLATTLAWMSTPAAPVKQGALPRASQEKEAAGFVKLFDDEPVQVRFGDIGSWAGAASCPLAALRAAIDPTAWGSLNRYYQRRFERDPVEVLGFIVEDNSHLFRPGALQQLFTRFLVPCQVRNAFEDRANGNDGDVPEHPAVSFTPDGLRFFAIGAYELLPFAMEPELDSLLVLFDDMTPEDLDDEIAAATRDYFGQGRTYRLRVHGFSLDDRPLWEIPCVVDLLRDFARGGGLGLLEVSTALLGPGGDAGAAGPSGADPGLGAFEAWLIVVGLMGRLNGAPAGVVDSLKPQFRQALERQFAYLNITYGDSRA